MLFSSSHNTYTRLRGPSDHYGCVRWQPVCPPGETEASLEQKQKEMRALFFLMKVQQVQRESTSPSSCKNHII